MMMTLGTPRRKAEFQVTHEYFAPQSFALTVDLAFLLPCSRLALLCNGGVVPSYDVSVL